VDLRRNCITDSNMSRDDLYRTRVTYLRFHERHISWPPGKQ